ncbi:ROK family protein [Heliophilum fasciatum]|uniref:Glucokinase n=1 Tax=Heliophilum fasciatum TaxID=35700 RepID=A0A4R2RDG7_9FIRM|nr:ROK family protein [Heliophilum fasciatum]MCW2279046.1 glucokinase [Heliophilum fasciatum]TCP61510.1 glucokinase [Heliophilum fasciatum]
MSQQASPLAIAIDLGGTSIKGALIDRSGQIKARQTAVTQVDKGYDAVKEQLLGMVATFCADAGQEQVAGVGIGIPGTLRPGYPEVVTLAPNLHWREKPLGADLRREMNLPLVLENDANLAALGEQWQGAGRGAATVAMITVGTGIGCGLILDGRLHRGISGAAGEFGHVCVEPEGWRCTCGRQGCLETRAGIGGIVRTAHDLLAHSDRGSVMRGQELNPKLIFALAARGDALAAAVVEKTAFYLGWSLANLINLLNPERIIIGGGVAAAGEVLLTPLREVVKQMAWPASVADCALVPAELGNQAGMMGAAGAVFQAAATGSRPDKDPTRGK